MRVFLSSDGNILTEVDHTDATTTYTYDLLGRLIAEVGNAGTRFYTYDTAGNRTQAIVDTDTTVCYTYNNDGELISETSNNGSVSETTTYTYDANGNLTKKTKGVSVTNYAYDVWNRMTSGAGATYVYNAQGLRVSKIVGNATTNFLLVGGNVWADSDTAYFRGIELISNDTQLYLYNVRGDVIQLLGFDGEVDKTYDYDAYGNEYARDLNDENPFRYCGEYYDTETGFIYLRARYYDPNVGRFTSVDPIKDGLNWYAYCENDPVNFVDPTGMIGIWATICISVNVIASAYYLYDLHLMSKNYKHNAELDANEETTTSNRYIYRQGFGRSEDFVYGIEMAPENSCSVIAIHNAKVYLGIDSSLSQTILDVQSNFGMLIHGKYGTTSSSIGRTLRQYEIPYKQIHGIDEMTKEGMYIISSWNDPDTYFEGRHTVAIEYNGTDYIVYNPHNLAYKPEDIDITKLQDTFICGYYVGKNNQQ